MLDQNPVFIPGPTNMPDRLRRAMQVPTQDHRSPAFAALLAPLMADLRTVFATASGQILIFPASGTGGWEAAITNVLGTGDRVLAVRNGMFSSRWIEMCQQHGLKVDVIDRRWGDGIAAEDIEAALTADRQHQIKAVLAVHNETATGVVSDLGAVRGAMDAAGHPALLLADCVSSLASMPFAFDEWGVDIAVAGSQKGFMLPAGLAILCISDRAVDAIEGASLHRSYFDFRDMLAATRAGLFPYTPPLALIHGLRESLNMLGEEGLEAVYARHARLAEGVRRAVHGWGLTLVATTADIRSNTVSAIHVPDGQDSNTLTDHAYHRYGVSFGVGLGEMNGRAFRIGHLGSLTETMVLGGLATIEMAMGDLAYPVAAGSGVTAAQNWFREQAATAHQSAA